MAKLNAMIRSRLAAEDLRRPGYRAHAERVAVYAVATGDRLGLAPEVLLELRIAAELNGLVDVERDLVGFTLDNGQIGAIVQLSDQFDRARCGLDDREAMSDAEAVEWLKHEAKQQFDAEIVEALLSVQSLIQPVGT